MTRVRLEKMRLWNKNDVVGRGVRSIHQLLSYRAMLNTKQIIISIGMKWVALLNCLLKAFDCRMHPRFLIPDSA